MNKTTTNTCQSPADGRLDPEVLPFRQQFDERSPLDEIIREGAWRMLEAAIDAEVEAFILNAPRPPRRGWPAAGRQNASLPAREILTGAGSIEVKQGRVRDKSPLRERRS